MKSTQIVKIAISALIAVLPAFAADGDLDTTFGPNSNGLVFVIDGLTEGAADIAIQSDDKIVIVLRKGDGFAVYRFDAEGSADSTFGNGGQVISNFSTGIGSIIGADDVKAVVVQPDGKIVVAGSTNRFTHTVDFAMARLNKDGTFDTSFGTAGKVHTDFSGRDEAINDIAVEGKTIVAVGTTTLGNNSKFAVARYRPNGSLDQSFATAGKTTFGWGGGSNTGRAVAVQTDEKIVVVGDARLACGSMTDARYFALARLLMNGSLDPSFGVDGKKKTKFNGCGFHSGFAVAIQPDGKILAAGLASPLGSNKWEFARYNELDGSLDTTFGSGGKSIVLARDFPPAEGFLTAVTTSGNRIIAGGWEGEFCGSPSSQYFWIQLLRLDDIGVPDPSFGPSDPNFLGQISYSNFPEINCFEAQQIIQWTAQSFALQSDGKIVTAGIARQGDFFAIALARFIN